jgi:hypothetical protein
MRFRLLTLALAALLLAAGLYGAARLFGGGGPVPAVPRGDQEVAWIHAATSGASWERFVAGVHRASRDWPRLRVDDRRAFLDQTTAVPEVVLGVDGTDAKLHIRWYKLTSDPPPLAFIGGGTSDRAVELARALDAERGWPGPAPLLLITTATANSVTPDPDQAAGDEPSDAGARPLMEVYPGRSFRFCFTNRQMAEAVVDFLWSQPGLRPFGDPLPALAAVPQAAGGPYGALALLAGQATECPATAATLWWMDDPYSIDLSEQFHAAFHRPGLPPVVVRARGIPYSVGGFYRPNAWEADAAGHLLRELRRDPLERQVLVLPASAPQARRVLRAITGAMPLAGRQLVALSGDSINVNNVYRDADLVWNIRAVPVPLVFFTHQNPVDWGDDPPPAGGALPTATDDVLLHANLVRILVESAYRLDGTVGPAPAGADSPPDLLDDADALAGRLRGRRPAFFDESGDRRGGRGEYVVALRPEIRAAGGGAQIRSAATLEVWTRDEAGGWRQIKSLEIDYGRSPPTTP